MRTVESIFEAVLAQAKQGSCKTCKWCVKIDSAYVSGPYTHWCEIQGNVNPIEFSQAELDAEAYPARCDEGRWLDDDEQSILMCLAYVPGYDGTPWDDPIRKPEAAKHATFMRDLGDGMHIFEALRNNDLAKLTAKVNAASDSLPAQVKG